MKVGTKYHCDSCGKLIREFTKQELIQIAKDRAEGTRTNTMGFCLECQL